MLYDLLDYYNKDAKGKKVGQCQLFLSGVVGNLSVEIKHMGSYGTCTHNVSLLLSFFLSFYFFFVFKIPKC